MIVCKVRFTCDSQEEAEKARKYLEGRLQNLRLDAPKEGRNPRYEGNQKVFLYGDILIPQGKEHVPVRARRSSRAATKPPPEPKPGAKAKTGEKLDRTRSPA